MIEDRIRIFNYKAKNTKKDYYIAFYNGKFYFVHFNNTEKMKKCILFNKNTEYLLYDGVFEIKNDFIIIK